MYQRLIFDYSLGVNDDVMWLISTHFGPLHNHTFAYLLECILRELNVGQNFKEKFVRAAEARRKAGQGLVGMTNVACALGELISP